MDFNKIRAWIKRHRKTQRFNNRHERHAFLVAQARERLKQGRGAK